MKKYSAEGTDNHSLKRIIKNNIYMLKFVAKYTPSYIFWMIAEGLIWGMIHSFTSVIFVKMLFDRLGDSSPFSETASVIGYMAAFSLVTYFFHVWYWNIYNPSIRQTLHLRMQEDLFKKARELDLACYDNPEFYNDFVWAINEADGRACGIMEDIGKLINRTVATFTIIGVLLTIDVIMVLAILSFVGIVAVIRIRRNKMNFKSELEMKPERRKSDYISRVFLLPDYAKEIRLSDADILLHRKYDGFIDEQKKITRKYGIKRFKFNILETALQVVLCGSGINILLLYRLMVAKVIQLGDFVAANNAIWKLYWQINSLMEYLVKFPEHSLYAEKFRTFMEYTPKIISGRLKSPAIESLSFDNVSFKYDSNEEYTLTDINLEIKKGEKIAVVGYNGAGKSTLIKLLMRLYDPTDGHIKLNGTDIREYDTESYRDRIGAVFQDYRIFAASIAENVIAGEYTEEMKDSVTNALRKSIFYDHLKNLKDGIDTHLTREFSQDGINLSGGESQKIAIARVFVRDYALIVMDEPSSALDPMSEYELNKTILEYADDKTVIFISHRLSTTRMADRIYMFESGKIIERGSHESLIKKNGKYAEMFNLQAEKYRRGN